jgi:mannose-6-phosphate isomerase-like protein (cupin superfamily)
VKRVELDAIPPEALSHDAAIFKQPLLRTGDAPGLTQFARSTIPAGRATFPHAHPDMTEVFFVLAGFGRAVVDGREHPLGPGTCLRIDPGETHAIGAGEEGPLELLYFGLAERTA